MSYYSNEHRRMPNLKAVMVIFQYKESYIFQSNNYEFLSSLFYKFRSRINDFKTNFQFLLGAIELKDPKKTLGEVNTFDSPSINIIVSEASYLTGGDFSLNFTDLSKQIYEEFNFTDNAPSYRIVGKGMNIYGICKYKNCEAFEKEVIVPLNNMKYNLIKEKDNLKCPACEGLIVPKTVGFYLCEYKIKGTKFENGKCFPFEFNGKSDKNNSIQYYNPDKNGVTTIVELIIEITKYL